jgi:hypothetical protein
MSSLDQKLGACSKDPHDVVVDDVDDYNAHHDDAGC